MIWEQIARVAHETNRAYCQTIEDFSQKPWDEADGWQKESAFKAVEFRIVNPDAPASTQHDHWIADKLMAGWVYGPDKDPAKKEHPCIVPYGSLPQEQRLKDYLFLAIVRAFIEAEQETATAFNKGE